MLFAAPKSAKVGVRREAEACAQLDCSSTRRGRGRAECRRPRGRRWPPRPPNRHSRLPSATLPSISCVNWAERPRIQASISSALCPRRERWRRPRRARRRCPASLQVGRAVGIEQRVVVARLVVAEAEGDRRPLVDDARVDRVRYGRRTLVGGEKIVRLGSDQLGHVLLENDVLPFRLGDGAGRLEELVLRPAVRRGVGRELVDLIVVLARPRSSAA